MIDTYIEREGHFNQRIDALQAERRHLEGRSDEQALLTAYRAHDIEAVLKLLVK